METKIKGRDGSHTVNVGADALCDTFIQAAVDEDYVPVPLRPVLHKRFSIDARGSARAWMQSAIQSHIIDKFLVTSIDTLRARNEHDVLGRAKLSSLYRDTIVQARSRRLPILDQKRVESDRGDDTMDSWLKSAHCPLCPGKHQTAFHLIFECCDDNCYDERRAAASLMAKRKSDHPQWLRTCLALSRDGNGIHDGTTDAKRVVKCALGIISLDHPMSDYPLFPSSTIPRSAATYLSHIAKCLLSGVSKAKEVRKALWERLQLRDVLMSAFTFMKEDVAIVTPKDIASCRTLRRSIFTVLEGGNTCSREELRSYLSSDSNRTSFATYPIDVQSHILTQVRTCAHMRSLWRNFVANHRPDDPQNYPRPRVVINMWLL